MQKRNSPTPFVCKKGLRSLRGYLLGVNRKVLVSNARRHIGVILFMGRKEGDLPRKEIICRMCLKATKRRGNRRLNTFVKQKSTFISWVILSSSGPPFLLFFFYSLPSPLAATSVATRMGERPSLNSARTQSRSSCRLSPWMHLAGYLSSTYYICR